MGSIQLIPCNSSLLRFFATSPRSFIFCFFARNFFEAYRLGDTSDIACTLFLNYSSSLYYWFSMWIPICVILPLSISPPLVKSMISSGLYILIWHILQNILIFSFVRYLNWLRLWMMMNLQAKICHKSWSLEGSWIKICLRVSKFKNWMLAIED